MQGSAQKPCKHCLRRSAAKAFDQLSRARGHNRLTACLLLQFILLVPAAGVSLHDAV